MKPKEMTGSVNLNDLTQLKPEPS